MELVDWAARWAPVPPERPCRVWLPAQRPAVERPPVGATPRGPRSLVLTLTPQQAADLPLCIPGLLSQHDPGPGDRVTVDLEDHGSVDVTGLALLLTALWRRVTTSGEVQVIGGTPALRAQLTSLGVTPVSCRAAVHGPPPVPLPEQRRPAAVAPGPVGARLR